MGLLVDPALHFLKSLAQAVVLRVGLLRPHLQLGLGDSTAEGGAVVSEGRWARSPSSAWPQQRPWWWRADGEDTRAPGAGERRRLPPGLPSLAQTCLRMDQGHCLWG